MRFSLILDLCIPSPCSLHAPSYLLILPAQRTWIRSVNKVCVEVRLKRSASSLNRAARTVHHSSPTVLLYWTKRSKAIKRKVRHYSAFMLILVGFHVAYPCGRSWPCSALSDCHHFSLPWAWGRWDLRSRKRSTRRRKSLRWLSLSCKLALSAAVNHMNASECCNAKFSDIMISYDLV